MRNTQLVGECDMLWVMYCGPGFLDMAGSLDRADLLDRAAKDSLDRAD